MPEKLAKSAAPVLLMQAVAKSYGSVEVLRGVDLTVTQGSIHGLVGLNGSGKTTTLDCLLGLSAINAGSIEILGFPPARLHESEGAIVAVFDTPSLHSQLTVRQTLQHAATLCPSPSRSVDELMTLLSLSRYSDYKLSKLSLGNRRRVSIAHALVGNPSLVLLDEPFNGLDAGGVDEVLALIQRLNRDHGMSFLLSSHQLPYLQSICTHLSILHGGRILASDSLDALLAGSQSILTVTTPNLTAAREILGSRMDLQIRADSSATHLRLTLEGATPAEINRLLVTSGIEVQALVTEQASIESLFRKLTGAAADQPAVERAA